MSLRLRYLSAGFILAAILIASTGKAHRLSGHPKALKGQLKIAKRQLRHDRAQGHPLKVDLHYVRRLERKLRFSFIPPHYSDWLCIHKYEGAWNDPNPPYYGGLQMDWGFMRAYGAELLRRKGTADRWTPLEQMWVAERAHRSGRGFYPWPNTARYCGLIG